MEFFVIWAVLAPLVGWHFARGQFKRLQERLERLERLEKTIATLQERVRKLEGLPLETGPLPEEHSTAPESPVSTEPVGPTVPAAPTPVRPWSASWTAAPGLSDFVLPKAEPSAAAASAVPPSAAPALEVAAAAAGAIPKVPGVAGDPPIRSEVLKVGVEGPNWEERIGGQWLTWLGAITAVIAVGLGLKLAYDQGYLAWILELPPIAYLVLGWLLGGGFLAGSLRLRGTMPAYAQGLAGGGIAILYLTTYAGHALYGVLTAGAATAGLIVVGAIAIALALGHDSVVIGWIGVILAYASPVILGGSGSSPAPLFFYLTGLNATVAGISVRQKWFRFRLAGFLATALLLVLWFSRSYSVLHFSAALSFVASNSLLFLAALMLPALLRRERGGEADLMVAVLNPLFTQFALYAMLRGHASGWQGAAALGFAAVYWAASRLLRVRLQLKDEEVDYLEQLFYSTSIVLMLLAVPLQLKGRTTTAAWALIGAGLGWVGYRTAPVPGFWNRTRAWGMVALGLSVGRLLLVDAGRTVAPGTALVLNERGFSFAVVMAGLAVPAALAASEWKASERKGSAPEAHLTLLTLALCGLMDLWMSLELSSTWAPAGWSVVAALALAFGWQVRSNAVRVVGHLVALPPLAIAIGEPVSKFVIEWWSRDSYSALPGWIAALLLSSGASAVYLRTARREGSRLSPTEQVTAVLFWTAAAAAVVMTWSFVDLGRGWVAVVWLGVTLGLLAVGAKAGRADVRGLGLAAAALLMLEAATREWGVEAGHPLLLHSRTVAAWSVVLAWAACAVVLRKWGTERERTPALGSIVFANVMALAWCCTEAMDASARLSPAGWAREAAQFALSATWALYAGGLIVTGLRRDLPGARWGGIGLILLAVAKVYLFDLGFLALGYRVLAFLIMAVVLLGVSFLYQRRPPTRG